MIPHVKMLRVRDAILAEMRRQADGPDFMTENGSVLEQEAPHYILDGWFDMDKVAEAAAIAAPTPPDSDDRSIADCKSRFAATAPLPQSSFPYSRRTETEVVGDEKAEILKLFTFKLFDAAGNQLPAPEIKITNMMVSFDQPDEMVGGEASTPDSYSFLISDHPMEFVTLSGSAPTSVDPTRFPLGTIADQFHLDVTAMKATLFDEWGQAEFLQWRLTNVDKRIAMERRHIAEREDLHRRIPLSIAIAQPRDMYAMRIERLLDQRDEILRQIQGNSHES